jgi:hypothetical protein
MGNQKESYIRRKGELGRQCIGERRPASLLALDLSHGAVSAATEELSLSFQFHIHILLQEDDTSAITFRVVNLCVLTRL